MNIIPALSGSVQNLGWRCYEGNVPLYLDGCEPKEAYTLPTYVYAHDGGRCAITGGADYWGSTFPSLAGIDIFAGFCTGQATGLLTVGQGGYHDLPLGDIGTSISTFGVGASGEFYFVNNLAITIYRVEAAP